jgi:hypothetical protein
MKKTFIVFLFITSAIISKAQNSTSDQQVIQMLKEFYIAYNTAWATGKLSTTKDAAILVKKLDSLQTKYCTIKLRKELKELYKKERLDHDLLTNDEYTNVEHLKTLKITKDETKANAYIVSYVDHTMSPAYKPIDKTVIIHITVAKESGIYKIADAYGDAISLR